MRLSVVIPTHNRRDVLMGCLDHLTRQTIGPSQFEVVVAEDRCSDGTAEAVEKFFAEGRLNGRLIHSDGSGAAAARNRGVRNAQCDLILFIDDDIFALPDLLEKHMKFHDVNPAPEYALLGFVTWHPDMRPTPFMHWMENGGPQFAFYKLKDGEEAEWPFYCTCNISQKRSLFEKAGGFDEDFKQYGFEDPELGYRLHLAGMKLMHSKAAFGHHYQRYSLQASARRNFRGRVTKAIYFSKPAGAAVAESNRKFASRLVEGLDWAAMAALSPLELIFLMPLANSRVPFPGFVYRHLHRLYIAGLVLEDLWARKVGRFLKTGDRMCLPLNR